jgi:8-oxo-dGTP pyrophosphatase MutT (NUDIX family)
MITTYPPPPGLSPPLLRAPPPIHHYSTQSYCNNCGKHGHSFHQCKMPITSYGVVCFRVTPEKAVEFLMICRRDTLGFIDFMRGKYSVYEKDYIMNMLKQMTTREKFMLKTQPFSMLWKKLWESSDFSLEISRKSVSSQYKTEEHTSRDKFHMLQSGIVAGDQYYTLTSLIEESERIGNGWEEAEWGFPKGRRNYQEKDYDCAIREFCEETGYSAHSLVPLKNILPYEEIFTGSNYKSYKHKYYIKYMHYADSLEIPSFQTSEVGKMEWKSFEECKQVIRYYNLEKLRMIDNIDQMIRLNV